MLEHQNYDLTEIITLPADYYQYVFQIWTDHSVADFKSGKEQADRKVLMTSIREWCEKNFERGGWHVGGSKISIIRNDYAMAFKLMWG